MEKTKKQWLLRGGLGAALSGAGLCCAIESGFLKHGGADMPTWILAGAGSLVVFISGLNLLADSVRFKIKMKELTDK